MKYEPINWGAVALVLAIIVILIAARMVMGE